MQHDSLNSTTILVDAKGAASMLGVSVSHIFAMLRAGKFGPKPVKLGRARRYRFAELQAWTAAGCPSRSRWESMRTEKD